MPRSLIYVSSSLLGVPDRAREVDLILAVARGRNVTLDVTGALIVADAAFAQVLEGPDEAIDTLMASIRRDGRHADVKVVVDEEISERRFSRWAMAYCGQGAYVSRLIDPLRRESEVEAPHAKRLLRFMQEFTVE